MEQSNQSQRNRATRRAGKEGLLVRVCGSVCGSGGRGGWWWSKKGLGNIGGVFIKQGDKEAPANYVINVVEHLIQMRPFDLQIFDHKAVCYKRQSLKLKSVRQSSILKALFSEKRLTFLRESNFRNYYILTAKIKIAE